MSLNSYRDSPLFRDGAELSATDLNVLRSNAMIVQAISKRAQNISCTDIRIDGFVLGNSVWKGGFLYRVGMETAHFIYSTNAATDASDPQFAIYFNGTLVHSRDLTAESNTTIAVTISDKGYTDYQIITVNCYVLGDPEVYDATPYYFQISDAYVFNLSPIMDTAYPGTTTFGDVNATNLNKISNSLDWLADRVNLTAYVPFMGLRNWKGSFDATFNSGLTTIWIGSVTPQANGNTRLYVSYDYTSRAVETYLRINVNGTDFNYGPYGLNETVSTTVSLDLVTDAGCVVNTRYSMGILDYQTQEHPDWQQRQSSIITIKNVYVGADSYTYAAAPTENTMLETLTYTALQARLNAAKSIIDAIKTDIDANSVIWERTQMFRGRYANDEFQEDYWGDEMVAYQKRYGDVLWVKGKGLSIGWGPLTIKARGDNEKLEYKFEHEESLTSGDQIESKFFYLDQFEGLFPGADYYVFGTEMIYLGEYLR
jgi:hypothetical protein